VPYPKDNLNITNEVQIGFRSNLKGIYHSTSPHTLDPDHSGAWVETYALTTCTAAVLSSHPEWQIAPIAFIPKTFLAVELKLRCAQQRATCDFFEAFK